MTEVSSPKVSTLAFLLVPFFLVRKLHEIKGHSLMEFSQHVSNMYPSVKSHATKSGGLDAPFFCLQTFWHRTLPSPQPSLFRSRLKGEKSKTEIQASPKAPGSTGRAPLAVYDTVDGNPATGMERTPPFFNSGINFDKL